MAAMILSGSAVHVKGFGSALVSARKRLMAACGSTTERKTPLFKRRRQGAIESLDLALLVERKHDGVGRRIDLEPDHVAQLVDEVRIVRA
jgi:hypothetical protein